MVALAKRRSTERPERTGSEQRTASEQGKGAQQPSGRGARPCRGARAALLGLPLLIAPSCGGLNLYSYEDDIQLGQQAYQQVLAEEPILRSGPEVEMAQRVTDRLVAAAREIDPQIELTPDELSQNFPWEVTVIDAPDTVNAFCLPGGKMAVYTGIIPVAEDDTGLAVVMGHEIAHATLRHGTERLTRNIGLETAIAILTSGDAQTAELASVVANLGIGLPFSRSDELEADQVGLLYMAQAGYDPRRAVDFWSRMAAMSQGAPPELLSTHPSDQRRIEQIQEMLPQAIEIYERRQAGGGRLSGTAP